MWAEKELVENMNLVRRNNPATIRDVANRALVSIGTASRVLNNYPNVEQDLRVRVLAAAKELGYSLPNRRFESDHSAAEAAGSGRPFASPKISHVAFCYRPTSSPLAVDSANSYFMGILRGVEIECRQNNLHLIYQIVDESEVEQSKQLLAQSHAEALLLINFSNPRLVTSLQQLRLPTILVDHYFNELTFDVVSNENYTGGLQATRYLIEKGHRRIGFVNGLPHYTIQHRFEGYRRALEEAAIRFDEQLVIPGNLALEGGLAAAAYIKQKKLGCTAYFCANDQSAFGFIQGLQAQGLRVPQDISVVGFNDVGGARLISPALTTIRANTEGVGRMAVRKLLERVSYPDLPLTQTLVGTELIERESVWALA